MDDSKKKPIMIAVIVVSLAIAGYVTLRPGSGGGGIDTIDESEKQWVKCNNPTCKAEYEMSKREFYKTLAENPNPNPMATGPIPLTCEQCSKKSLFAAINCPTTDCGTVFIEGSGVKGPGDYPDRCPSCKLSAVEERMKSRTGVN